MSHDIVRRVLPQYCWNTAVSCLACLSDSLQLDQSFEHVAGLSGEAFRLPLFANAAPGAWQHSVSWPQAAQHWLESLGIDGEICWTDAAGSGIDNWLERQRPRITETLARGLPVMYWDNLAWGLILAEDADTYEVSGIPDCQVPEELRMVSGIAGRCFTARGHGDAGAFRVSRDSLRPRYESDVLLIHPAGRLPLDPAYQLSRALHRAADELAGNVAWPRMYDARGLKLAPQFGTAAMERLASELRSGDIRLDGLIISVQTMFEMRRAAQRWVGDVAGNAPDDLQPRLKQAAEFLRRIVADLRPLALQFSPPADPRQQLKPELLGSVANALYEIRRTEETLTRLLRGIAGDAGVFS